MPTLIGHHDVKDANHWPARRNVRSSSGPSVSPTSARSSTPRTRVALLMDVPDMDALMAAMQTKGAADAMEQDGALPDTLVILVEA